MYRETKIIQTTSVRAGIGLCESVFLVFLVLKLIGKITWSWWWVTAPLWIPIGIGIVIAIIIGIILLIANALDNRL